MKKLDVFQQQRPVKTLKTAIAIIFIKYSNSLHKFLVKQPLHMFYKIGVLVLSKFTREHLYWGLFFNKTSDFIKKEALAQVLSCEFCKIFKNTFFTEIFYRFWLLPNYFLFLSDSEEKENVVDKINCDHLLEKIEVSGFLNKA